jgi:predicted N-acyltransferase
MMEDGAQGYRPLYLLMEDEAGPAALCIAPTWDLGPLWERILMRRVLRVYAPYSASVSGIATRSDVRLADALDAMDDALAGVRRRQVRMVSTVTVSAAEDAAVLQARGYHALALAPDTVMDIRWRTFDDYLAALRPKDRREHFRNLRNSEKDGLEIESAPVTDAAPELYELYLQTARHHGLPGNEAAPFGRPLFEAMATHFGADSRIFRCYRRSNGRTILYIMGAGNARQSLIPFAGLDYGYGSIGGLYWLVHARAVAWAIERGIGRMHGGTTTYPLKQRLGYQLAPRWLCYRANATILRPLMASSHRWVTERFGYRLATGAAESRQ